MKYRYAIPMFLGLFLLQTTWLNHIKILGVAPNLVLCAVIITSFFMDGYTGIVLGCIFGLLQDICFGIVIGPTALAYFVSFLLIRQFQDRFYQDSVISVFLITALGTVLAVLLNWAILALFGGSYHILHVLKFLPVELGYNFAVIFLFYFFPGRKRIRRYPEDSFR